jgi:hypothetical protein
VPGEPQEAAASGQPDSRASAPTEPGEGKPATSAKSANDGTGQPSGTGQAPTENPKPKESALGYTDVSAKYPADYIESTAKLPEIKAAHDSPENWIGSVNQPGMQAPGRNNNCAECARAVQSTWAGEPGNAAAMAPRKAGEPPARMTEFTGVASKSATMEQISDKLTQLGPGSSAIVGFDRTLGTGHWFNAVNDKGTIKAVDGQSGRVGTWPPSRQGVRFDKTDMAASDAIFFGPDGKVIK